MIFIGLTQLHTMALSIRSSIYQCTFKSAFTFVISSCRFIYILDSSNSSSITFWTSKFSSSSRNNWIGIWTGNLNGSWTDKQSYHFSAEMLLKSFWTNYKWDDCLSVQLPFELPVQIPVQLLLELEANLLDQNVNELEFELSIM